MSETKQLSELEEVREGFTKPREVFKKVLPKVDPALLNDLLEREAVSREARPYTIEVFTKEGVDTETARQYIMGQDWNGPCNI